MREIRQNNNRQWFMEGNVCFQHGYALVKAFNLKGKTGWSIINKNYQEAFDDDYFKFENHIDSVKVYNGLIITKKVFCVQNKYYINEYKTWVIKDNTLVEIPEERILSEIFERCLDKSKYIAVISDNCVIRNLDVLHAYPPIYVVCDIELNKIQNGYDYLWFNLPNDTKLKSNDSKVLYLKDYR